jgi:hypothetical protein
MRIKVVSGGQTGVDQAALRAARACGLETGGYMPLGYLTEDGPRPEFRELYGVIELPTSSYPARTRQNALEASATIWFGVLNSHGSASTHRNCWANHRPILDVVEGETTPSNVARWIEAGGFKVLNVAGNRESSNPGIGERTERFLTAVFRRLAEG